MLGGGWDPDAVADYDRAHPGRHMNAGRYLAMADGGALDGWLAARCDELLGYEVERFNTLRPIAWAGGPAPGPDPNGVRATADNPAGWFASPGGHPYEPPAELARRHAGMPVLVDGYGVPSSRGVAALEPGGANDGGHDEAAQAAIDVRLTQEIRAGGCAGGVLFEWMDEWWRRGAPLTDLDAPAERAPLWHNAMDPAQHQGVLAMDAGAEGASALSLLGHAAAGRTGAPLALGAGCDPAYVYLAVALAGPRGRAFPWDSLGVTVAFDTYRADRGQQTLPGRLVGGDIGFEFVAKFAGPANAGLRVTPDYDPRRDAHEPGSGGDDGPARAPIVTVSRDDGRFDPLRVVIGGAPVDRGRLRRGTLRQSTLADWTYDRAAGLLEIRLPWTLLNVTDPSSGSVLYHDHQGAEPGTAAGDGFRIGVITWRKGAVPRPLAALPGLRPGRRWSAADFTTWRWTAWEEPEYHERLKPAYEALKAAWGGMTEELSSAGDSR